MERHLAKSPHGLLVGDRVTVADIACWGWIINHGTQGGLFIRPANTSDLDGVDLKEFPSVDKWLNALLQRPAFQKGRHVPN